jgi:hypothetical protein
MDRFRLRGDDAGAVDAQALARVDEAELDGVPIEPRQLLEGALLQGGQARFAIGRHVVAEDRIHQQRHMSVDVMKDVGFLEVVHLLRPADPPGHGEAPGSEMGEEDFVGNETGDGDDPPSRRLDQGLGQAIENRDAVLGNAQPFETGQEFVARPSTQGLGLALEELVPEGVIAGAVALDRLIHGVIGAKVVTICQCQHGGPPIAAMRRG